MPKLVMRSLPYCHKHVSEFLCGSAMPECDIRAGHPKLIFPCPKECNEVRSVCQKLFEDIDLRISCQGYLSKVNTSCFYKNVSCEVPKNIENGKVVYSDYTLNSTANYSCNSVFLSLSGSETRKCLATGKWDFPSPRCVFNVPLIWLVSILPSAVILFLIVLFVHLFDKRRIFYQPMEEWVDGLNYDAFVVYSSRDAEFVENELKKQNPPLDCVYIVTSL